MRKRRFWCVCFILTKNPNHLFRWPNRYTYRQARSMAALYRDIIESGHVLKAWVEEW